MKLGMKKVGWIVIIVMVGLLSLTAVTAASDIVWPWSSEPGFEPQALSDKDAVSNRVDEGGTGIGETAGIAGAGVPSAEGEVLAGQALTVVAELQPDDNGYTGPIPEANQVDMAPSGDVQAEAIDWDTLIPEGAPDQVDVNADPNWSGFYYYHVAGSALRPRDSSNEWASSGGGGCLSLASGSTWGIFNVQLDIPHGARIDYLRLFYYDTSTTSDSTAWVTRYDDAGGIEDITYVSSELSPGYGTSISPLLEHIVDNVGHSYILNWRPMQVGSTMMLCGLRVAYRLP